METKYCKLAHMNYTFIKYIFTHTTLAHLIIRIGAEHMTPKQLPATVHTCQPIQITSIKYSVFIYYFEGIWPYRMMNTGKHHFHEIL